MHMVKKPMTKTRKSRNPSLGKEEEFMLALLNRDRKRVKALIVSIKWDIIWEIISNNLLHIDALDCVRTLRLAVPKRFEQRLVRYKDYSIANSMLMLMEFTELCKLFWKHSVKFVLLKGYSVNHYRKINLLKRPMQDIDLLIDSNDSKKIRTEMIRKGYSVDRHPHYHHFDCRKKIGNWTILVEVHDRLFFGHHGFKASFKTKTIEIKDDKIDILKLEDQIIYSCIHLMGHSFAGGLRTLYELNEMLRKQKINWSALYEKCTKTNTNQLVYYCLVLCETFFRCSLPEDFRTKLGIKGSLLKRILLDSMKENLFKVSWNYKIKSLIYPVLWPTSFGNKAKNIVQDLYFIKNWLVKLPSKI